MGLVLSVLVVFVVEGAVSVAIVDVASVVDNGVGAVSVGCCCC